MGLVTFGHGRLGRDEIAALLRDAGIARVVDVRRFPGSRANPAAASGEIPRLLTGIGIAYRWDERLGGRRRLSAADDAASPDTWWRVAAFRAYAAWTRSESFEAAMPRLLDEASMADTAVLCSESVWWRCHRRLIADVAELAHRVPVRDLMHTGRCEPHPVAPGARLRDDGRVVWDGSG